MRSSTARWGEGEPSRRFQGDRVMSIYSEKAPANALEITVEAACREYDHRPTHALSWALNHVRELRARRSLTEERLLLKAWMSESES
jgi:hypothetical protein